MLVCARAIAPRVPGHVPESLGAEWAPRLYWTAQTPRETALAAALAPPDLAVVVYVNEGRWVVMCPDCAGAQLAARDDHRFMCCECANVAIEGLWRPTIWPADVEAIETELARRQMMRNRNWLPGQTVEDLAAEYDAAMNPPPPEDPPVDELVDEPGEQDGGA